MSFSYGMISVIFAGTVFAPASLDAPRSGVSRHCRCVPPGRCQFSSIAPYGCARLDREGGRGRWAEAPSDPMVEGVVGDFATVEGLASNAVPHTAYFFDAGHSAKSDGMSKMLRRCVDEFVAGEPMASERG